MNKDKIIDIYRGDLWECQLLESILLDAGIDCFLRNNVRTPYGPIASLATAVIVMINESDRDRAISLMKEHGYVK